MALVTVGSPFFMIKILLKWLLDQQSTKPLKIGN